MTRTTWLDRGREALRRGAWAEARTAFERALEERESPEALEGLGWALHWLGDDEGSLDQRERAYRASLDAGDRVAAARVAAGIVGTAFDVRGAAVASGWLERARNLLRGVPTNVVHGWVTLNEGHYQRIVAGDPDAAAKLARKAARIALQCGEPQLELLARSLEGLSLVSSGRVEEGMRRVDEATAAAMAGEIRDLDAVAQICCMLLYACERVRDYRRAAEWQERVAGFCRRFEIEPLFAACSTQHAAMLSGSGRWPEAEAELQSTLARIETTRPLLAPDALVHLGELRRRQGRYDEALSIVRRVDSRSEAVLTRAAIALDRGDPVTALELAGRLLDRKLGEKWIERAAALEIVVAASLATNDRQNAAVAHARLGDLAARVRTPMTRAMERLAAGLLSDRHEEARAAFVESFESFEEARAPFEAAIARMHLAKSLLALGRHTAAIQEIDAALAAFETLGAARERDKALALRRSIPEPPHVPAHPLTGREREVLHLIAGGLADKELAAHLSLSEHTIHRHVSNIMRKLGASSRTAAVAVAVRSGWI